MKIIMLMRKNRLKKILMIIMTLMIIASNEGDRAQNLDAFSDVITKKIRK